MVEIQFHFSYKEWEDLYRLVVPVDETEQRENHTDVLILSTWSARRWHAKIEVT